MDADAFLRGYWIAALVILLGTALFNILYNLSYQRKIRALAPLLASGRAAEFAAGMEKLLQTAKGTGLRSILQLNLAAGWLEAGQIDQAVRLLEDLSSRRFRGGAEMIRRLNLCLGYFRGAQYDQAMALYRESGPIFQPYREHKTLGGNLAELDILAAIQEGQSQRAETLLRAARTRWTADPRLQEDFRRISRLLEEQKAGTPPGAEAQEGEADKIS